jgi:beta-glucosidase
MAGLDNWTESMAPEMREAAAAAMAGLMSTTTEDYARGQYTAVGLAEAIQVLVPGAEVIAVAGTGVVDLEPQDIPAAFRAAQDADVVVLALGGRSGWFGRNITEGEGTDSADIDLPACQVELVRAVAGTGTPTVGVVFMGRPYGLAAVDNQLPALLTAYYPGPEGSRAIADSLFGVTNPGGKLPYTLPRGTGQVPIYHAQKRGSGYQRESADMFSGYADLAATPLYPFGHGLSYTTFDYADLRLSGKEADVGESITVSVALRNSGTVNGTEVAQLYLGDTATGVTRPAHQLAGFARVNLEAGAEALVEFTVALSQLGYTDAHGDFVMEPGPVTVSVGSSSADLRAHGEITVTGKPVNLAGRRSYLSNVTISSVGDAGISGATDGGNTR